MRLSRRPLFFAAIAFAALILYEPTPDNLRWLNIAMAVLSAFWFVLLAAEEFSRQRDRPHRGEGR